MTTLSDQIAALEADRDALKVQCEKLDERLAKQAGALLESRARIAQQDKAISRLQAKCNSYEGYFRSLHHGLNDLKAQNGNAGAIVPESRPQSGSAGGSQSSRPAPVLSLKDRISRVGKNGAAA
jgi:chromosome segregation ATPase